MSYDVYSEVLVCCTCGNVSVCSSAIEEGMVDFYVMTTAKIMNS